MRSRRRADPLSSGMITSTISTKTSVHSATEAAIREGAYRLYCQGGCLPDREVSNWLEAEALLRVQSSRPVAPVVAKAVRRSGGVR